MQENKRYAPLRPEARPVDYSKLDKYQREAFDRLVDTLAGALPEIETADPHKRTKASHGLEAPPAWLDYGLSSRMAFLHGDRGTGKSTVLMSLIKLCSSAELHRQQDEKGAEMPAPTRDSLSVLRGRVVWLEPIDMARFPGSANLLAAVLARIEDAARPFVFPAPTERGGRDAGREAVGMLGRYPEGLDPLLTLQRLQTTVATAWDGNLPDRGGQIDPDAYAVEVMRAERERMTFNVKLSEALDSLACGVFRGTGAGGPIFVVALDDVDLNPLRCLEALKLLHLLAVPRVFTIVLGDMQMVELALNLKICGDFSALVGHHARENLSSMLADEMATRVAELSADAMRKLLPPAQRIRLGSMTRAEALNFLPIGTESDGLPRLHALLQRCPADMAADDRPRMEERDIYSLRDFLLYPVPKSLTDETEITEGQLEECTYTASQILRMRPRLAADWWFFLKEVDDRQPWHPEIQERAPELHCTPDERSKKRHEKWKAVIELLARHCRSMIDEDPTLTAGDRRRFHEGLRQRPASGEWELSFPVRSMPERGPSFILSVADLGSLPFKRRVLLYTGHGWCLQPGTSAWLPPTTVEPEQLDEEIRRRLEASFSPPTTWGLVLLYDLLSLGPTWKSGATLWIYRPLELWGFSEWKIGPTNRICVAWPAPGFLSFWGYDIFLSHWNAALRHINPAKSPDTKGDSVERYVYAWLDAGAAVLLRDKPLWSPETQKTPDWDALINRLSESGTQPRSASEAESATESGTVTQAGSAPEDKSVAQIAAKDNPRGYGAAHWLTRLAYFLWPAVSGIQKTTADRFFTNPDLRAFWQKNHLAIKQYVEDILKHPKEKAEKALGDEDVEKLRKDWEEYRTSITPAAKAEAKRTSKPEPPPSRKPRRPR